MSPDPAPRPRTLSLDPPFACFDDVLDPERNLALLREVEGCRDAFTAAPVTDRGRTAVDRDVRASRILTALGDEARAALVPIVDLARRAAPLFGGPALRDFTVDARIVHYGDGDFFAIHRDAPPPSSSPPSSSRAGERMVSFVYQFFRSPPRFQGGTLRLYAEKHDSEPYTDVDPRNNTLTLFLPITPHEVIPVRLTSGCFAEGRLAINGWLVGVNA